jgi:5'-nucleotidase
LFYFYFLYVYRHSQARVLESEINQNTLSAADVTAPTAPAEGTRLRRRSSVEAPNVSLLLELNHATAASNTGEDNSKVKAPRLQRQSSIEDVEMKSCKLEPRIEGRIVIMTPETVSRLQNERQKWELSIVTHTIKEEN